jgi:hypothetical protein
MTIELGTVKDFLPFVGKLSKFLRDNEIDGMEQCPESDYTFYKFIPSGEEIELAKDGPVRKEGIIVPVMRKLQLTAQGIAK